MAYEVINVEKSIIDLEEIELKLLIESHNFTPCYKKFVVVISSYDMIKQYLGFKIIDRSKPLIIKESKKTFYIFTDYPKNYKDNDTKRLKEEFWNEYYHFMMNLPEKINGKFRIDFKPIENEEELTEWQD